MTVIYIHGVKVRDPEHGIELGRPFQRWLGPKLGADGDSLDYRPVYWGDIAARFRWDLASRPRTPILHAGGEDAFAGLGSLRAAGRQPSPLDRPAAAPVADGPVLGGPQPGAETAPMPPLASLPARRRADFLADLYLAARPSPQGTDPFTEEAGLAGLAAAAEAVAERWDSVIADAASDDERLARLMQAVEAALRGDDLLAQGGFADWMTRVGETLKRAVHWPVDAVSTVFAELRPVAHEFVAYFIGDVMAYLNTRETTDGLGAIPTRVLDALEHAQKVKKDRGEPIVVVTHSMGGQLFYDAITAYADRRPALADLEVDHWFSMGAQVSFFAELGLFTGQPDAEAPERLPRPRRVKAWTNFYDPNDLVGFIMAPVFDGVSDREYDTGYGLAFAHSGFLARPSFFRAMADAL